MIYNNFKCTLLSWEDVTKFTRKVSKDIKKSKFSPDVIVGIIRGGLVPSMLLSDELGIKELFTLKVEHWGMTAKKNKKARLVVPIAADLKGKKILLVDDLTDTGESIMLAIKNLKEQNAKDIKVATLVHKAQSNYVPDFYAKKVGKWKWIILPWNIHEDLTTLVLGILNKNPGISKEEIKKELKKSFNLTITKRDLDSL